MDFWDKVAIVSGFVPVLLLVVYLLACRLLRWYMHKPLSYDSIESDLD